MENKKKPAKQPTKDLESKKKGSKLSLFFNKFSSKVTKVTGSVYAFIAAILVIIIWAVTGPIFNYSDTWQLVINTGTTIITFLMVFIIQHSQNKDQIALQLKLDELINSSAGNNKLISVEDLSEEELAVMKKFYVRLSGSSDGDASDSDSPEDAEAEDKSNSAKDEKNTA
ncbi:low affinity iron permease family protein [Hanamia caeni]|uniref:Low affinity iron permease family protein n=1 Tax=Hanamia caeni TaxID=2294116 RepID=A0A3M9N8W6_9BACT|nr:low affinity iron permease family protein [Hanamia caeni]RNI33673.1 low affinity iron permease family protein [Hanamia caeni]